MRTAASWLDPPPAATSMSVLCSQVPPITVDLDEHDRTEQPLDSIE